MSDWIDKQAEDRAEGLRGPRPGYTDPRDGRRRRTRVSQDTFIVFRPWQGCNRCQKLVNEGSLELPEDGDHVCPHTRHRDYLHLMNQLRNPGPHGPVKLSYDEFTNERGERYAAVAWEVTEDVQNDGPARNPGVPRM